MTSYLHSSIQRIFNIYPGEGKNALLFALLGFLWAFASTSALKFADALFILHVGAQHLPTAYTINSTGMFVMAILLLYSFHRYSSYRIFATILSAGMLFYLVIFLFRRSGFSQDIPWFWYSLKLAGFILFTVLMTCYWTFIDQYHHLQDAKRLYTLFSATIFLGAASTGLLMHTGLFDLDHLILLIIALLGITLLWARYIAKHAALVPHEESEPAVQREEAHHSIGYLFRSILRSPFTLLLMTGNFITYLLLVITEYNYMFTFGQYFASQDNSALGQGTEAQLTLFLGKCLASVSIFNLIFGLFIYSRLVRRFGISSLLIVTPILLIIAFTGWSLSSTLFFPLIGFFVFEGTNNVIDDNNFNLLLNAVPSKLKYKIRVMIESFFEPVGMLTSAFLLSLFQQQTRMLGLVLACISLTIVLTLRQRYLKAIFFNLSENAIQFHRTIGSWMTKLSSKRQKKWETQLLSFAKSPVEQIQTSAFEWILALNNKYTLQYLLSEATAFNPAQQIRLIQLLEVSAFATDPSVVEFLHRILEQHPPNEELNQAVRLYLAKKGLRTPLSLIDDLHSEDLHLLATAIIALKISPQLVSDEYASPIEILANQRLRSLLESDSEDKICMGLQIMSVACDIHDVELILPFLSHPSLLVARTAARAIGEAKMIEATKQAHELLRLISQTNDPVVRIGCLKALGKVQDSHLVKDIIICSQNFRPKERRLVEDILFQMGLRTVPILLTLTKNPHLADRSRLLAGRILGRLSPALLRAHLFEIIRNEMDRAYFYFFYHHTIQNAYPQFDLSIVTQVLITGYQSVIDFIIQLLCQAGEVEDPELLSRSIRSTNPKVRSQVIETLEKTCEPRIFYLLRPLLDEIPLKEKLKTCQNRQLNSLNLTELLDKMNESQAQIDRLVAIAMRYRLNLAGWRESLRQQISSENEIFHHFAYELLG